MVFGLWLRSVGAETLAEHLFLVLGLGRRVLVQMRHNLLACQPAARSKILQCFQLLKALNGFRV